MKYFSTLFFALLIALLSMSVSAPGILSRRLPSYAVNSSVAGLFRSEGRYTPGIFNDNTSFSPADSAATAFRVMLFDYCVYDSVYATQMRNFVTRELPGATVSEFMNESLDRFDRLLNKQQAVVITYPSNGDADFLAAIGKKLDGFMRNGGLVIITGAHETSAIQALGLLSPAEAYYYEDATVQSKKVDHPILKGVKSSFSLSNFVYPMEFSDNDFVTLSESEGLPVLGYKEIGEGKLVYLGLEYYADETIPSKILGNIFKWALTPISTTVPAKTEIAVRTVTKRTEEVLYSGSAQRFDLKIYPNPYVEKASLEINIDKAMMVSAEMTNETGSIAAVVLSQRMLSAGFYRFDIPNLAPGIYFVKCKFANHIEVRKLVKVANN